MVWFYGSFMSCSAIIIKMPFLCAVLWNVKVGEMQALFFNTNPSTKVYRVSLVCVNTYVAACVVCVEGELLIILGPDVWRFQVWKASERFVTPLFAYRKGLGTGDTTLTLINTIGKDLQLKCSSTWRHWALTCFFSIYTDEIQMMDSTGQLYTYADDMLRIGIMQTRNQVLQSEYVCYIGELSRWWETASFLLTKVQLRSWFVGDSPYQ